MDYSKLKGGEVTSTPGPEKTFDQKLKESNPKMWRRIRWRRFKHRVRCEMRRIFRPKLARGLAIQSMRTVMFVRYWGHREVSLNRVIYLAPNLWRDMEPCLLPDSSVVLPGFNAYPALRVEMQLDKSLPRYGWKIT